MEMSTKVLGKHLQSFSQVTNGRIKQSAVSVKLWRYISLASRYSSCLSKTE